MIHLSLFVYDYHSLTTYNKNILLTLNHYMSSTLPNTTYQREEINQACCFLNSIAQRSDTPTASREYAHSLPAKSREKKINLIIAKRGNSQEKQPGISLSKNLANTNPYRSQKIIKNHPEYTNGTPTHASK